MAASKRFRRRKQLNRLIGKPPVDDSLASINWMMRALGLMALEIDRDESLTEPQRRAELVRIATAMSRLRDPDRLYRAERTIRDSIRRSDDLQPGPELAPAPDLSTAARPISARRGRPPSRKGKS